MSRWIRPKYNEQCKENIRFTKKSVLIDSRKVPEGYWLDILREKCPEGLGKISENLKNNKDLVAKDFLDDEDTFLANGAATVKYPECDEQNNSFAKTPRRLSVENDEVNQEDVLPFSPGEQEYNNGSLQHGFKTPVFPKHNTPISSITATPCLFSPELLSQATQDVTPKNHLLNETPRKNETISGLLQSQSSSSASQSQSPCEHNSQEYIPEKSPDILALMIADNRPRSSLALLSAASSDDEIDGWSDSMATPPVQWSQSPEGSKEDVEEQKKPNDKHVARTLFEGTNQDVSSEMSGFSVLESIDEQNDSLSKTLLHEDEEICSKPDDIIELGRTFHQETSLKDGSLLKMINAIEDSSLHLSQMDDLVSSDVLRTERTGFSRHRRNCSCEKKTCTCLINKNELPVLGKKFEEDVEWSGSSQSFSSLLSQPRSSTMLPPPDNTTSPIAYSQEVQKFLDLVQSTPKLPGNMVKEKRTNNKRTEKYNKINTENDILHNSQTFISSGISDLLGNEDVRSCGHDSETMKSSFVMECDSMSCNGLNTPAEHMSSLSESSSLPRRAKTLDVTSKPHYGGDANDSMSFEVPKTPTLHVPSSAAASSFPKEDNALKEVSEPHGFETTSSMSFDISLTPKLPSSSPLLREVNTSKPRSGDEAHDVSFGSISTSLEEAMVEETEKVLTKTTESAQDRKTEEQLSDEQANTTKLETTVSERHKQVNTEKNKGRGEEKSPPILLGVRRSSRSKRFSYPVSRKPLVSRNSMECKVKEIKVDATSCDLSKIIVKREEIGSRDVKIEKMNEREKESRNMEHEGKSRESQKCGVETSHFNDFHAKQEDNNHTGKESKGWMENVDKDQKKAHLGIYASGLNQTSCNKNEPACMSSNIKSTDTFDLKNTTSENQELNHNNMSAGSEGYITEDMTDNTLISIQEDFKTPKKATCPEMLYDMDELSQFPVELLSPTQLDPCARQTSCKDVGQRKSNSKSSIVSGFKTAGGKGVSISEEAMKKAKVMFDMENKETDGKVVNTKASMMTGFKTAGGKDVSISEEAIKKAKAMFEMENKETEGKVGNTKASMMTGFKTAGGKDVSISEEAIKKAKAMFEMENKETEGKVGNTKASMMTGFKTAGGKDVSISEEAIKKAKAMFEMENKETKVKVGNTKASMMTGFKTASGKDVNISEEAIKKAKAMFEMENRETDGNIKASMMTGFKTAGGKDVSISEEAIKKAKAMFEMENKETKVKVVNTKASMMTGFKTAGGKDVNISEEAIKKAKAMFEMENKETEGKVGNTKASMMTGFKTAGGKDVSISEEAIKKAKAMFEMENKETEGKVGNTKASMMTGFKTAGGKDVSISEEAIKKAKAMFEMENKETEGKVGSTKASMMTGFKTAGGKDVNISEEAIKKAKAMFDMENRETDGNTGKASMMTGFKTAGGKDVNISEEAIKKAKAMFEMENRETDGNTGKASMMTGFKTAGGKDVNISEEAIKKAKAMFEMENRETDGNTKASMMTGFKTAGGKAVSISEEAIKKAKAMFDMENRETEGKVGCTKASMMTGFKTAGGKAVSISEEAIKKAKAMFEMENRETDGNTGKASMMTGFKTAGGKDVNISEEAIKKAKAMFEMENRETDGNTGKASMMTGFKTAGGKDVNISEEAIKKAKAMFEMENRETDGNTGKASMMTGFKTAGGKDVNISEEAIKKAKAMFEMENKETDGNTKASMMTGFKTAGGKDVNISEEAIKKAKAMFDMENKETDGKVDNHVILEKSKNDVKTESGFKVIIAEERLSSCKRQKVEHTGAITSSSNKTVQNQPDQEVPLFKVLTPSKRSINSVTLSNKTPVSMSSQSPISSHCTSIVYSTPIQDVDESLSREILESSAALIADESFTNFSECSTGIQDERFLVPSSSTKNTITGSSELCQSEPRLSKREALLANARRRSAPFLSNGDRTNPSLQERSTIMPLRTSPSSVLYDRRSKMFSPPLKPLVVSPNMSTPMPSFPPARKEAKRLFVKQGSSLKPSTTSPPQPFPLAAEGRPSVDKKYHTTAHTGIPKRQFTTPYRSTSPLSNSRPSTHKEEGNGSPERKRARILGPGSNKRSGAKPDNIGRESVKPRMGYLFELRQNSTRISLKKYVDDALPRRYTEQELRDLCVMDDVMTVTSHNAESYRFVASRFFSKETCASNQGVRTDDGGLLFVGADGGIGVEEMEKGLSTTPGVDVKLIPHGWIANHYRWIVWKLAAMETAFPRHFAGRCLTPDWVLCQLKYRYDREIDRSHRSALKKILERDDLCSRTLVLCVSSVTPKKRDTDEVNAENTSRNPSGVSAHEVSTVIELTDGWYSVNAVLDAPLTNLISKGKIFEGLKLCINGAELVGSDQAVSPLEAPSSLMLRISCNSTRRARWNTRLGFHSYSHPFPLPLSSLYPNGGVVGCVDVVVLRQYPVEYMEKLSNGTTVFRNSRAEEREAKRFGRDLDRAREAVFTKVQREFEEVTNKSDTRSSKKARSFSPKDISKLRNAKELYDSYTSASDPSFFEECLDNNQKVSLEDYRRISLDSKRAELENMFQRAWDENDQNVSKRTVVPMLKVRLVNYSKCNENKTEAVLSIWRPNEDVVQLLAEGSRLRIYHLMASGSRYRQGLPSLQFSTTRSTRYKTMTIDHDITDDLYSERKTTSLDELQTNPPALYSEVDLVGVVVSVTSHNSSSLQTVYISDEDHYLVSIKFWGGLKTYALDDLVKPRSLVACSNLVVRSTEHASCPTLAFNELSTLTLKPREPYLRTALDYLNDNIQDMDMFMDIAQGSLDKIRRPDSTPNMNCSRVSDRDSPVHVDDKTSKGLRTERENTSNIQGTSPKQCDSAPGCAQSVRDKDLVPTPVSRPLLGQCKRKLLDSITEPPAAPSINVSVSDSVRRDFKRPRKLTTGCPQ